MKQFNKHLVILGSARSGTSWLSELIARQYRYRILFEPEHEFNTKKGKQICDKLVTQKNIVRQQQLYLKDVFNNRIDNDWIAQLSNRKLKRHLWPLIPNKFIIKMVRCNLAVDYLSTIIPTIVIIRNPYKVIESQNRVKFPWLYDLDHFAKQEEICDDLYDKFKFGLTNLKSKSHTERLMIRWCIENVQFIENKNGYDIYEYEDLVENLDLFSGICERYGLEPILNIEDEYKRPSSKTHPRSYIKTGSLNSSLSKEDYKYINQYLDVFKIDKYKRKS